MIPYPKRLTSIAVVPWLLCFAGLPLLVLGCSGDVGKDGSELDPMAAPDDSVTDGALGMEDAPSPVPSGPASLPTTQPSGLAGEPEAAEPGPDAPEPSSEPDAAPGSEPEFAPTPEPESGAPAQVPTPSEPVTPATEPEPQATEPEGSVPAPTPAPSNTEGSGYDVDGECMPECLDASADPDGDGWGWENDASCVVKDSAAAGGRARCGDPVEEVPGDPGPVEEPEAPSGDVVRPDTVASSGFFVSGGRLYDANGNDFVIRGINHGHYWFRQELGTAFSAIANTGANSIRIVWEVEGSADEMRTALQTALDNELIPMIELHDVTGDESNASLLDMARYYSGASVSAVLQEFEASLLVNIANEWSGQDWRGGYEAAIDELRNAGINHTLVIDANGWGQNAQVILQDGQALLDHDPQHNLLFSTHMYQSFGSASAVTDILQGAVDQGLPIIVGEFGFQHGNPPTQVAYQTILSECARLGLGYMPWSWKGNNSDVGYLDMSSDWAGNSLTDWGRNVIEGANGIAATSQKASLFLLGT